MALYLLRAAAGTAVVRAKNGHAAMDLAGPAFDPAEVTRLMEDGEPEVIWGIAIEDDAETEEEATVVDRASGRRRRKRLDDPAAAPDAVQFLDGSSA